MRNCARHFDKEWSFSFCLNDNYEELLDRLTTKEARFDEEEIKDYGDYRLTLRNKKIAFGVYKFVYYPLLK